MACLRLWVPLVSLCALSRLSAQAPLFESRVQPLLKTNCLPCHNQKNRTSGLALDTREAILAGGNRGAAVKPGSAAREPAGARRGAEGRSEDAAGRTLTDEQIAAMRNWIETGRAVAQKAPRPRRPRARTIGRFSRRSVAQPPPVKNPAGCAIRSTASFWRGWREKDRSRRPKPTADTLLRRVSLDLTGLPPSPQEIRDFLADTSPDAYEKVVDRLLASPHYGERWGRHWLDVARYADSDGYTIDAPRHDLEISRLGDQRAQSRHAVRPVRDRADRRATCCRIRPSTS